MMNRKLLFLFLVFSLFTFACQNQQANSNANKAANPNAPADPPFTANAKPEPDPEIAVIETEGYGTIKIELYSNIAPKHVARFKELANEGFYNGVAFHRIDPSLGIIQGGDPLSKDDNPANDGTGSSGKPNVPGEFTDVPYEAGIVGAARAASFDSANSQFFIMTKRQPSFDKRYTVFGKVIEGLNNVVIIAGAPVAQGTRDRPAEKLIMKSVRIEKR